MKKAIDFLKAHPIITAVFAVLVAYFGTKLTSPSDGATYKLAMVRVLLALSECALLYLISREKTFDCCTKTTGYVVRYLLPTLAIPMIFVVMGLFSSIAGGVPLRSDWAVELISAIWMYLFVGIFEEVTFRAIINDALLIKFRNTKGIFVIIAIVSSLVFGAVHVVGADILNPSVLLSASMKTISAGFAGLCFLFMYWKTRNLWGIAIMHGLYDFSTILPTTLFESSNQTQYTSGADGYAAAGNSGVAIIAYSVQIVLGIAVALFLYFKVVRKIDFEELRRTW